MREPARELTAVAEEAAAGRPRLSVITPAYNEAANLPVLHERLAGLAAGLGTEWEWIVVDDHSMDETPAVLARLAEEDGRVRGIRLARNHGSHVALVCGLDHARGDCAVVLAADLQDPPEEIPRLLREWRQGAQVVWAVRAQREGAGWLQLAFARLYYALMRRTTALRALPATGADFFLVDRRVIEALKQFRERHVSLLALITWMGFRQAAITYTKQARLHGRSGWTTGKKLKLAMDSITSFTYFPIRLMSYVGFLTAAAGFSYALVVVSSAWRGHPPTGWASLMVVVLIVGGIQMLMLGVLGEYLWRALDEARERPKYLVEALFESSRGPSS